MNKHSFTVIAAGLDHEADDFEDRFFEAGCDDATISIQKGAIVLDFNREAQTFARALKSAMVNVETAGAKVVHVEPDHLVSLSDIAARVGISRAAASNYARGIRGEYFPAPVARVTTDNPLWDWFEVARWLRRQGRLPKGELQKAVVVRAVNVAIAR